MLRSTVETAIRFLKRGVPSLKKYVLEVPSQVSTVQNAAQSINVGHRGPVVSQLSYQSFFFSHWIKMTSHTARLRCSPIYRMMANRRNPSLYLAFIGLGYFGHGSNPRNVAKRESHVNSWLQDVLKKTVEEIPEQFVNCEEKKLKDFEISDRLGKPSCNSAVYAAQLCGHQYAIKMLFNYAASSQSHSLHQAFEKEFTVLSSNAGDEDICDENSKYKKLPAHPNVMKIVGSFADVTPDLPDAAGSYPAALPSQYGGLGRNRTLFFVMPRFSCTLSEYMTSHECVEQRTSLVLFTQLLEGLAHLKANGIVHRDLKGDNLLVNEASPGRCPHLVITDFDCCLAEKHLDFVVPYETDDTGKGGNSRLMAPEVISANPGPGHVIDYSQADEWSAGVLAYEIFGQGNPFENCTANKRTYESKELPEIMGCPQILKKLVKQMLARHPNDRPGIKMAATVCQLLLWAPYLCVQCRKWDVDPHQVERWFLSKTLSLATEMLSYKMKDSIPVEKQILFTFLSRSSVEEVTAALKWMASLET